MAFIFAQGPEVRKVSRKEAELAIRSRDDIPEDAEIAVTEVAGQWVAAIHVAEFPPPKGGGPADASEEAPGPKSEGPDDAEPSAADDGGPPSDDGGGDEGSEGPSKEGEKGGEKHEIQALLQIVQSIAEALGIPDPAAAALSPVPGEDGPPGGPPGPPGLGGPPPGAGGPPPGPHGGPHPPAEQKIQHERALKPGEVPPGSTPIGAPAFSHVLASHPVKPHPWAAVLGTKATFETRPERIPETHTAEAVEAELAYLANGTGYKVKQVHIELDTDGHRIARGLISRR